MIFDILSICLMAYGVYNGYKKGLLIEIISWLVILISIIATFKFLEIGMNITQNYIQVSQSILPFISFVILFLIIFFTLHFLGKLLKNLLTQSVLKDIDKILGAGLGLLKFSFLIGSLCWILNIVNQKMKLEWIEESKLIQILSPISKYSFSLIGKLLPYADKFFEALIKYLQ